MELDEEIGEEIEDNYSVNTTPLLEVFSVSVNTSLPGMFFDDCDRCEVYGTIKATNGLGHVFDLYNRTRDNPEFIDPNCAGYTRYLSLTGLTDGRVIVPYEYVTLEVALRDRARSDVVIASGELTLDYKQTFYTEHGAKIVLGKAGFVTVHYATFPYAVTASVDVIYFSKDDDYDILDYNSEDECYDYADYDSSNYENDDGVEVYGTVAARTNFPGSDSYGDITTISSILLKLSHDQCVRVKSRSFIQLSRSTVAIPAHSNSPLQIYVDIKCKDGSTLANGVLFGFPSSDKLQLKKDIVGHNGRIRVRVTWGNAYEQRYRGSDWKCSLNEETKLDELIKRLQFSDPQPSVSVCDGWLPQTSTYVKPSEQLLEVFSVGVGSIDLKPPFKLYGNINVNGLKNLFNRDQNSPQICFDKIEVQYCFRFGIMASNDFGIYVDLKDAEGNVFVQGLTSWVVRVFDKWYNKRICSLIRGDRGYVALHFMIIYDGVEAKVKVLVKANDTNSKLLPPAKFYGSLVARYSNHEYSTSYDEKYYQSVLFERGSDDPVHDLENDGYLPLSKSLVCVPRKCSLIIKADLKVGDSLASQQAADVDCLQGTVEFNRKGQSSAEILGQNYSIDVIVTRSK